MATTTQLLRHINAMRVLRLLRRGEAMSRADIARELKLTRATVGNAMLALLDSGLVMEGPTNPTEFRVGRPGVEVRLDPTGSYSIGLEIGMRSISAVVVDLTLQVVAHRSDLIGNDFRDPDIALERALTLISDLCSSGSFVKEKIIGIGVAIPGLVDHEGMVVNAPFLGWRQFPLHQRLAAKVPSDWLIRVHNDASAFAAAERAVSASAETEDLLLVLLSEGIGGALVRDGRVVGGGHGYAGEIGHTIVTVGGKTDTFEMFAGVAHFETIFPRNQTVGDAAAATLARRHEPEVAALLERWAQALAIGLANAVHLLDPRQIVLGGPLSQLFLAVERQVAVLLDQYLIYGFARPPIRIATTGSQGSAIGAAAIIQDTIFDLPLIENGAPF